MGKHMQNTAETTQLERLDLLQCPVLRCKVRCVCVAGQVLAFQLKVGQSMQSRVEAEADHLAWVERRR